MRGLRIAVLAVALLAPAAPAGAATVHLVENTDDQYGSPTAYAQFLAAAGEANAVAVMGSMSRGAISVRDDGATLQPGSGCRSVDAHEVTCSSDLRLGGLSALLGDADDRMAVAGDVFAIVSGQAGNDEIEVGGGVPGSLRGGTGADRLRSGAWRDSLVGGPGPDELQAGAGDDELIGDSDGGDQAADPDVIDGGAGVDIVSYAGRRTGVRVDLAAPERAGAQGERDALRGIEGARGGRASDVLLGDGGPNALLGGERDRKGFAGDRIAGRGGRDELEGSGGDDVLDAGAGRDVLYGGGGRDRMDGGPGPDHLALRTGRRGANLPGTSVRCGVGRDTVFAPPPRVEIGRDCEALGTDEFVELRVRSVARGFSRLRLALSAELVGTCRIRVLLRLPGRRTAAGRVTIRATTRLRPHSIALTPRAAAALRRGREPRLDVSLRSRRCGAPDDLGELRIRLTRA